MNNSDGWCAGLRPDGLRHCTGRAAAGYKTIVREVNEPRFRQGHRPYHEIPRPTALRKGKVTAEARDKTLGNLTGTTDLDDLKDCDLVIEAIVENLEDKRRTYARSRRSSRPTRSSRRTRRRSASPSWPRRRSGRTGSAACTSSTRFR